jgi:hypothetical protein
MGLFLLQDYGRFQSGIDNNGNFGCRLGYIVIF